METNNLKTIIETLYSMNRCLLGEGYDNALLWLKHLLPFEVLEFKSGTKIGTWTVPDEWIVRDAWVKYNGEKIIDYQKQPLSLVVGSLPFKGTVTLDELRRHWHYSDDLPEATPYEFKYYDKDWGFCVPKVLVRKPTGEVENTGEIFVPKTTDNLPEGDYEVFIDTEYRPGVMKLGVYTKPGKSDREIILIAHLDHPFQANDNLSGLACLTDLAQRLNCNHTIKLVICPETIGSMAYALTQDLSKVDFVISVDICGNTNSILLQKSFDPEAKINRAIHLALQHVGDTYRKGGFRFTIGSDEGVFNDPIFGIPGVLLTTFPYKEYHTADDTPDKIDYEKIKSTQKVIEKAIEIYEKDFIPKRNFKGFLARSPYGIQTPNKQTNLAWDYVVYNMDGKQSVIELAADAGLHFNWVYDTMLKLEKDEKISRVNPRQKPVKKTSK